MTVVHGFLLGILVRNTIRLPELFNPGIRFGLERMLRVGDEPFGFLTPETWNTATAYIKQAAKICLAIAMAAVALGTRIGKLISIDLKPLGAGLVSAVIVGGASVALISVL